MNDLKSQEQAGDLIDSASDGKTVVDQEDKLKHIVADNPMIYMHLNGF